MASLAVVGNSMAPTIPDGALVLADMREQQLERLVDEVVVALVPDYAEYLIKVLRVDPSGRYWILRSVNTQYRDRIVPISEAGFRAYRVVAVSICFVGGASKLRSDLNNPQLARIPHEEGKVESIS